MTTVRVLAATTLLTLLAGCMPVPTSVPAPPSSLPPGAMAPASPPVYPPVAQPVAVPGSSPAYPDPNAMAPMPPLTPTENIAGLKARKPDLCRIKDYEQYIGQPGSVVSTLGLTRPYRIVEYRGIEPQEYVPDRIVFRLDSAGNIFDLDCG